MKHLKSSLLILVPNTSKCCITFLLNYSPYWHFQVNKLIPSSKVLVLELQVEWRNKTDPPGRYRITFFKLLTLFLIFNSIFYIMNMLLVIYISLKYENMHRHWEWENLKNKNFNEYKVYCFKTLDLHSLL